MAAAIRKISTVQNLDAPSSYFEKRDAVGGVLMRLFVWSIGRANVYGSRMIE